MESIQDNVAPAITGAKEGTSREKTYHELNFESRGSRKWYHKLCCFYKVFKTQFPRYLFNVISTVKITYIGNDDKLTHFKIKQLGNSFFTLTVIEWNKLDLTFLIPKVSLVSKVTF